MQKVFNFSAVAALVLAVIVGLMGMHSAPKVQGITNLDTLGISGLLVGSNCTNGAGSCNGTLVSHIGFAACNLLGADVSQAASSSAPYDCAVTGVTSSDDVIAQLASSTVSGGVNTFMIASAKASSTSGFVTVVLYNAGVATAPSAKNVGSSTAIWIFR